MKSKTVIVVNIVKKSVTFYKLDGLTKRNVKSKKRNKKKKNEFWN